MTTTLEKIFSSGLQTAIPEGALTVSKWAETYRFVSSERSARPGLWRNSVVPFLAGIMDAVSEPGIKKIIFQKSSQVGGSELLNNIIGYFIHIDPSPILMVIENELKAQAWSKESFAPMLRDTPALAALVAEAKERDSSNTIQLKMFRGGYLATAWATSPATLSSRPIRILLLDEVDAFEPTKEGDPVKLAEARQKTFSDNKKEILVSSPRLKETSVIEREYLASDQRKYFVPCPDCGEFQVLKWANVKWDDGGAANAYYVCDECGVIIENSSKMEMLLKGEWRATASSETEGVAGFWINEIYSPFTTWGDMASNFLSAKKHKSTLQTFVNTSLGETWEEKDEEVNISAFAFLKEEYEAEIPRGVLLLTAGVDVQKDRLEVETVGWGKDEESWSIDHHVIEGDPNLADVWDSLSDYLQREWEGARGQTYRIKAACIDSGGHHTNQVYRFAKANAGRRWFAIKGANTPGKPLVSKPSIQGRMKVRLYTVGTDTAKESIHASLRKTIAINERINNPNLDAATEADDFAGYCHFPDGREDAYFKQFFAERQVTKFVAGVAKKVWEKISQSARNEALDLRVYAMAALGILNVNLNKMAEKQAKTRSNTAQQHKQRESELHISEGNLSESQPKKRRARVENPFVRSAGRGNFATSW